MNNGQLTEKQKSFCEQYLVDNNATQAAIRAGYSKKTAASIGSENRKKPKIQKYISQLTEARNLRTQVTADRILQELAKIGLAKAEKGKKTGDKLKALGMLGKHVGFFDSQPNLEKQARTKDVSEIDPIEYKKESIEFYNQMIHDPNKPTKIKLAARKQLDYLLGLDQISTETPEEYAAKVREALMQMDACTMGITLEEVRKIERDREKRAANLTIC